MAAHDLLRRFAPLDLGRPAGAATQTVLLEQIDDPRTAAPRADDREADRILRQSEQPARSVASTARVAPAHPPFPGARTPRERGALPQLPGQACSCRRGNENSHDCPLPTSLVLARKCRTPVRPSPDRADRQPHWLLVAQGATGSRRSPRCNLVDTVPEGERRRTDNRTLQRQTFRRRSARSTRLI
jgi:hypothetical protein